MGNPPPPPPSRYNASKEEKKIAKQLCPSLQDDRERVKLMLSESIGEYVSSLFRGRTKMQVDDPLVD
jgi:hypothetical protein